MNKNKEKTIIHQAKFNEISGIYSNSDKKAQEESVNTMLCIIVKKLLNLDIDSKTAKRVTKVTFKGTGYYSYFFDYKKPTQQWLMNVYIHSAPLSTVEIKIEYPLTVSLEV